MAESRDGALTGFALAATAAAAVAVSTQGRMGWGGASPSAGALKATPAGAARLLTQASFGPTDGSISDVQTLGYGGWIASQIAMPVSASHLAWVDAAIAGEGTAKATPTTFYGSFWRDAVTAPDQLRQRMKMALSEIFVVSFADTPLTAEPGVRAMASYYDMLGANAFGSFRVLLEQVTLHPVMGLYLTYLGNVKENPATGQHPDENFAREVLQLMSTGLYLLNPDGTPVTDGAGARIPTFSHADIQGLAKVFTGFSWYAAKPSNATFFKLTLDPDATVRPMIPYPAFHSVSAKSFLGATIPAAAVADPLGDLKIALDTIFHHPNVGPFIGRQLIQRFVTSNPSPAYVSRVAATFADDGTGTRGNLGAVLTAVLMDPEARDDTVVSSPTFGKLREPVLRLANWMRSFGATSVSGNWLVGSTSAPTSLGQTVLTAPSVFNFFSPGYTPPGSSLGRAGLFAPEFQAVNEVSVAGYLNTLQAAVGVGLGLKGAGGKPDVQSAYVNEVALAPQLPSLLDRLNLLLLYGQMSAGLRAQILRALNGTNSALRAVRLAVFIILASPEYVAQR